MTAVAINFFIIGVIYEREQKLKRLRAKKMTPEQVTNTLTAVLPILVCMGAISMLMRKKEKKERKNK
jgi:hypothetical protein